MKSSYLLPKLLLQHKIKACITMRNTKMAQMKDGKVMNMTVDLTLSDGSTLMANGK